MPAPGGSPNFVDSLTAVTLGGGVGGPPSALLGVGLAGLVWPDVHGREQRRGRAAARLAFLPLSGEVPPTRGEGPDGRERVRKSGRARA